MKTNDLCALLVTTKYKVVVLANIKLKLLVIIAGMLWINIAFAQPIIRILESDDSLSVKNQIAQYLAQLGVHENIYLSVNFSTHMPRKLAGMTFCLNAPAPNIHLAIRVWVDARLDKTQQKLVLAHEMIHVKQYAKGELIIVDEQQMLWKGRKYYYRLSHNQQAPWENEAYRTDNLLAKQWKEHPEIQFTASNAHP